MKNLTLLAAIAAVIATTSAGAAPASSKALLLDGAAAPSISLPERAFAGQAVQGRFNAAALDAGRLELTVPGGKTLVASRQQEFVGKRGERSWVGEFDGQPGSLFSVTSFRGNVHGFVYHGSDIYEIESRGGGQVVVYKVDESKFMPEGEISDGSDPGAGEASADAFPTATVAEPIVQDLLVVYTPAAVSWAGSESNLQTRILNAVAAMNTGYQNSNVNIQMNLVGMTLTQYTEDPADSSQVLNDLRGTTDGKMDEIHPLRDSLGADFVALISKQSDVCGRGWLNSSASYAFSLTDPSCLSGHTLAHELGHNQGNHHDRLSAGSTPAYPYSYGYRTCDFPELANGQVFRTVMAYSCSGSGRVNYFSNPSIFYNNAAQMGIAYEVDAANSADNARSMNNTAASKAAFRSSNSTPPVSPTNLTGQALSSSRIDLAWTDNASDESGYRVERATSGNYTTIATLAANATSFSNTGLAGNTLYTYRVVAYNGAGNSGYTNTVSVSTLAPPPPPSNPEPASVSWDANTATLTVGWADSSNETGYQVVRETWNSKRSRWGSTTTMNVAANLTSMAEVLSSGTYRYRVQAIGESANSAWVQAACSAISSCGTINGAGATAFSVSVGGGGKGGGKGGRKR
ncbi:MAG: reprolysin-like metallopeptidase [Steroidobacteraceae bacterium]